MHRLNKNFENLNFEVFSVRSGLTDLREKLVIAGVPMRNLKRYDGCAQLMCDREDPEGNVFQLSQAD